MSSQLPKYPSIVASSTPGWVSVSYTHLRRFGYEREISQLKEEIEKYRADYEENTKRLNEITTNPDAIEQIAREKYLMKKPNEDIYVFED